MIRIAVHKLPLPRSQRAKRPISSVAALECRTDRLARLRRPRRVRPRLRQRRRTKRLAVRSLRYKDGKVQHGAYAH